MGSCCLDVISERIIYKRERILQCSPGSYSKYGSCIGQETDMSLKGVMDYVRKHNFHKFDAPRGRFSGR